MRPKISVIVPIYGTEKYLDKCLLSVRNQTFKDIEIICVDDCSPDESYKIVEKHIQEDRRVSLIRHHENLGVGGARNTAIHQAKAEYIASVDSDDYIELNMLEALWEGAENSSMDIVCCGFNTVDENGIVLSFKEFPDLLIKNENNDVNIFTIFNPSIWNKLWRKSLFIDNNIYFPNHDYFEDMSTTPRLLTKAKRIKCIEGRYYQYYIRLGSITNRSSEKHLVDYFKSFELILNFLEDNHLLGRYQQEFNRHISGQVLYYARNLLCTNDLLENKKQYLRLLMLFKFGFSLRVKAIDNYGLDDLLNATDLQVIEERFIDSLKGIEVYEDSVTQQLERVNRDQKTIKLLRSKLSAEISFTQMIAVIVFAVFTSLILNKKERSKLINRPQNFFKDSKNNFARKYASFFNII